MIAFFFFYSNNKLGKAFQGIHRSLDKVNTDSFFSAVIPLGLYNGKSALGFLSIYCR